MGEEDPENPRPKTNVWRRDRFLRRHRLNILYTLHSKKLGIKDRLLNIIYLILMII